MTLSEFDRLDPNERSYWIADWVNEQSTCRDCGRPLEQCTDADRIVYPQRRICYPTMEREAAAALYAELHADRPFHDGTFTSWAKERSRSHPYGFAEGVSFWVADVDVAPWDEFTTKVNASPVESLGEQTPGEHPESTDDAADDGDTSSQVASDDDHAPEGAVGGDEQERHG